MNRWTHVLLGWLVIAGAMTAQGVSLYHDFGGEKDDIQTAPIWLNRKAAWYGGKTPTRQAFFENDKDFHWVKAPVDSTGFITSRGQIFRRAAKIHIKADTFPSSGTLYFTLRYKDNTLKNAEFDGVPIWGKDKKTPLGVIGGKNDHRWKTVTIPVEVSKLQRKEADFVFTFGNNYGDQHLGELNFDKVKLATEKDISEFEPDAAGLWPEIDPANLRFAEIAKNNEYVPGEGPFFPFGGYLESSFISDGGSATEPGRGAMDTWQILEEARVNAVIIHGWAQNWGSSKWPKYPRAEAWAAPGMRVGMGLDQILIQAQGHGIKVMPNFLTDTRRYWIVKEENGSPDKLKTLEGFIRRNADHPAIWGWNPVDEWDHEDTGYAKPHLFVHQLYKICKDASPNRPVFMSQMGFGGTGAWRAAAPETDIFANDTYFPDGRDGDCEAGGMRQVANLDKMRRTVGDSKARIAIPFMAAVMHKKLKPINGEMRPPNATEMVWQAYYSIAHGMQGLMYFYLPHPKRPNYPGLDSTWAGFRQVGDELFGDHGIAHALIAPSTTIDIMGEQGVVKSSNPNIHFIYKETKSGARVLLAVNMKQSDQEVTFTVPGMDAGPRPVHFENRTVETANGGFNDSFGRFERHVYVLKGTLP